MLKSFIRQLKRTPLQVSIGTSLIIFSLSSSISFAELNCRNPNTVGANLCRNQCCFTPATLQSIQAHMASTTPALYDAQKSILVSRWADQETATATKKAFKAYNPSESPNTRMDEFFKFYITKALSNPAAAVAGPGIYVSLPIRQTALEAHTTHDETWLQLLESADSEAPDKNPHLFFFKLDLTRTTIIRINEIFNFLQSARPHSKFSNLSKSPSSSNIASLLNPDFNNAKVQELFADKRDTEKHIMGCCLEGFDDPKNIITSYDEVHPQWAVIRNVTPIDAYLPLENAILPTTNTEISCAVMSHYLDKLLIRPKRNDALLSYVKHLKHYFCKTNPSTEPALVIDDKEGAIEVTQILSLSHLQRPRQQLRPLPSIPPKTPTITPGRRRSTSVTLMNEGSYTPPQQAISPRKPSRTGSAITPSPHRFSSYTPIDQQLGRSSVTQLLPIGPSRPMTATKDNGPLLPPPPRRLTTIDQLRTSQVLLAPRPMRNERQSLSGNFPTFNLEDSALPFFQVRESFHYTSIDSENWEILLMQPFNNPEVHSSSGLDLFKMLRDLNPGFEILLSQPLNPSIPTLETHARAVLNEFIQQIETDPLFIEELHAAIAEMGIRSSILRLAIALHDIGIPFSNKNDISFARADYILKSLLSTVSPSGLICSEEYNFLSAFILHDCMGEYLTSVTADKRFLTKVTATCGSLRTTVDFLKQQAAHSKMKPLTLFRILKTYFFSHAIQDGSSGYNADAEAVWRQHLEKVEKFLN